MTQELTELIYKKIKQQSEPPRNVDFTEILAEVLKINSMRSVLLILLILGLTCIGIGIFDKTNRIFSLSLVAIPLLFSLTPFVFAFRITKAIRTGHIKFATVKSVNFTPSSNDTIDSLNNGMARGEWRIPTVGLVEFEVDEPWAKKLSVGSCVELLVAKPKSKNIFPLKLKTK